jgi:hypothetical protein
VAPEGDGRFVGPGEDQDVVDEALQAQGLIEHRAGQGLGGGGLGVAAGDLGVLTDGGER